METANKAMYSSVALLLPELSLEEALASLERMPHPPSVESLTCILRTCRKHKNPAYALRLHAYLRKRGLEAHKSLGNYLVPMLVEVGRMCDAQQVFDRLVDRNEHSWTSLISGYIECGEPQHAFVLHQKMQEDSVDPSGHTFLALLKACARLKDTERGQELHAEITRKGLLERDRFVASALVDMYAKCGLLAKAQEVFDKLPVRDAVSWNALIAGYAEYDLGQDALNCFEQMQLEGVSPTAVTFICVLKACGSIGDIDKGQEIHAEIAMKGSLERDPFVASTLVDMYAKCGLLAKAQEVFDKLPVRVAVSWNALIAGYAEGNLGQDALNCFEQMQLEGLSPTSVTFVCILKACGSIGAIDKGQEIHAQIATKGLLETDPFVASSLVDMYAKCGLLVKAQEMFDKLPVRDAVSWTALIAGYAQVGESENVFLMLDRMRAEGTKPDGVTFLSILTVCNHTGLVEKGQTFFEAMSKDYGITPTIEHHNCMVDLLCRAGQLDKAVVMIKKMRFNPSLTLWHSVLGACWKWGNVELGKWAFEHAVELDKKDAAAYVLMSNIYADADMPEDAKHVELMRLREKAWKKTGQSWWTDAGGVVHSFLQEDAQHSQSNRIYAKLEDLSFKIREEGYVPDLLWLSKDISDDLKESNLCQHSEKLAILCALINTPKGVPIHVVKNLQVCRDCHLATMLISKVEQRTILVRDASRFHVFEKGKCSCGDYW